MLAMIQQPILSIPLSLACLEGNVIFVTCTGIHTLCDIHMPLSQNTSTKRVLARELQYTKAVLPQVIDQGTTKLKVLQGSV